MTVSSKSLPLGEGGSRRLTDEGNATQKIQPNSEKKSKADFNFLTGSCLRIHLLDIDTAPLIRLLRRHLPPGEGLCWAWCNCRGPHDYQGSALEARKQGEPGHPVAGSAAQGNDINGTRLPTIGNKGVLRTIGSKPTFGDFSLARKVTRRRQNIKQKNRRLPTKRNQSFRQKEIRKQPVQKDRLFCRKTDKTSALGELGSAASGLQAVLLTRPRRRCRPGTPEII